MRNIYEVNGKLCVFDDIYNLLSYINDKTGLSIDELRDLKYESFMKLARKAFENEVKFEIMKKTEPDWENIRKLKCYKLANASTNLKMKLMDEREGVLPNKEPFIIWSSTGEYIGTIVYDKAGGKYIIIE